MAAELNDWPLASSLLVHLEGHELHSLQGARRERVRENFGEVPFSETARVGELVEYAAAARDAGDLVLSLTLLLDAALRCFWTMPPQPVRDSVVRAAEGLPVPPDTPVLLAILASADPASCRDLVSTHLAARGEPQSESIDDARLLGIAAYGVGEFVPSMRLMTHAADGLREDGRLGALGPTLVVGAWAAIAVGHLGTALPAAEEGERLSTEAGLRTWAAAAIVGQAVVLGIRGRSDEAAQLADRGEALHGGAIPPMSTAGLYFARAVTAFGVGDYATAYDELKRLLDPLDESFPVWDYLGGVGYLADSAVILGRTEEVRARAKLLDLDLGQTPSQVSRPGEAHALAVLADDDAAIVEALGVATSRFDGARLQLARGTRLRRELDVAASREPLRAARDEFDRLGAVPWGDLARRELRAAGEASEQRPARAWEKLSTRELQIAQLAASGLSNKEIGGTLFFSHRTVASHLYRIYPKLGITSRAQLTDALRDAENEPPRPN